MVPSANHWVEKLRLTRHPEGGSFNEIYRSDIKLQKKILPVAFNGERNLSTSIYFLLEQGQFSAFHRIASDEQWHFYYGGTLLVFEIQTDGALIEHNLGNDPLNANNNFQCMIKAGSWFGSRPADDTAYSLAGCTVAPGFDFADFELANREDLIKQFPQHNDLITALSY
ncbi:MAG: cupin domain-containing protein [Chitinophagaceae bacterium]